MKLNLMSELSLFECEQVSGGAETLGDVYRQYALDDCKRHCLVPGVGCDTICAWVAKKAEKMYRAIEAILKAENHCN